MSTSPHAFYFPIHFYCLPNESKSCLEVQSAVDKQESFLEVNSHRASRLGSWLGVGAFQLRSVRVLAPG